MVNVFVRFLGDPNKDPIFNWQWGRLKRREQNFWFIIVILALMHLASWVIWAILVAPYPQAINVPSLIGVPGVSWLWSYLWMIVVAVLMTTNVWIARLAYKKHIFLSWLILGMSVFLQLTILLIVISLGVIAFK